MSIIRAENLHKQYGETSVFKNISFEIRQGEVVCVIGPSGSGKTTLLRCLAMLESLDKGNIVFEDQKTITSQTSESELVGVRNKIGVVFQDFHLWSHKTVLENVSLALTTVKKVDKASAQEQGNQWLDRVGLLEKACAYPEELSGGQKQRVAIARTLAMNPSIILLDEITAALDPLLAGEILKLIKRLAKDGRTMLVVTHHMMFAREISDRIIFLDGGVISEEGTAEKIFERPENERTKEFVNAFVDDRQQITVYEGYDDFQAYHIGLLKRVRRESTGYVMGAVGDRWFECMGDAYGEYTRILKEKKITWKWTSYRIEEFERSVKEDLGALLQISLIPKEYVTPSNFNIWEDTIILQTFGEPPAVIELRNKELVTGYLNYFNLLWEIGDKIDS